MGEMSYVFESVFPQAEAANIVAAAAKTAINWLVERDRPLDPTSTLDSLGG